MAFPAQTKDNRIVQIVDKVIIGGGAMLELFTDEDGKKYTRDLITAHAPHILIPIEDSLLLAENMVAAGADGAEQVLERVKIIAAEAGILDEVEGPADETESGIERVEGFVAHALEEAEAFVEKVEDALGFKDDTDDAQATSEDDSETTSESETAEAESEPLVAADDTGSTAEVGEIPAAAAEELPPAA